MYTLQSLWTQAREGLDVTTIIFNNRSYAILNMELDRVGAAERRARRRTAMLDLTRPDLDFVALGQGHGRAGAPGPRPPTPSSPRWPRRSPSPGPHLIEAMLPKSL